MVNDNILLFMDISSGELILIFMAIFLVFGPKKIPEFARKMGKIMFEFRKAANNITKEFNQETGAIKDELNETQKAISEQTEKIKAEITKSKQKIIDNLKTEDNNTPTSSDVNTIHPTENNNV
jgi:Tat protein translocase TatB subunit